MESFKKRLFTSLIILGSAILVFAVVMLLLNSDINKTITEVHEMQAQIHQRNQTIELLTRSTDELDRLKQSIKVLENILPNQDELIINFRGELEQIAEQHNLILGFNWLKKETTGKINTVSFAITLTGDYKDIIIFLQELELHRYIISVLGIDLKKKTEGDFVLTAESIIYTAQPEDT